MKTSNTNHTHWAVAAIVLASALSFFGCRRDMQDQPKIKPLRASKFFPDGRSARPIPAYTIARDELNDNDSFHTGWANGTFLETMPVPVDRKLMVRGEQRFNIYCSPCHGVLGDGNGMIARRGLKQPANFHNDRLRQAPPGYIFQVISHGYGAMMNYSAQVPVEDRWAIVAYIKALQLSRNANIQDVPAQEKTKLGAQP